MRKKITKIIAVLTVTAVMTGGISSVPGLARTVLTTDAVAPSKGCMFRRTGRKLSDRRQGGCQADQRYPQGSLPAGGNKSGYEEKTGGNGLCAD